MTVAATTLSLLKHYWNQVVSIIFHILSPLTCQYGRRHRKIFSTLINCSFQKPHTQAFIIPFSIFFSFLSFLLPMSAFSTCSILTLRPLCLSPIFLAYGRKSWFNEPCIEAFGSTKETTQFLHSAWLDSSHKGPSWSVHKSQKLTSRTKFSCFSQRVPTSTQIRM